MHHSPKRSTLVFIALLALTDCTRENRELGQGTSLLELRSQIPDLLGRDQAGNTQRLRSYLGRPLLVYFYPKDGTPGCTKEACAFRDVWKRFESEGVQVIGVSRDDSASHAKFAQEHRIPFPLIADPESSWANAFGVPSREGKYSRVSFLFERSGKLSRVYPQVDPGVHAEEVLNDVRKL